MLSTLKELTIQLERENGNQATLICGPTVFGKYFGVGMDGVYGAGGVSGAAQNRTCRGVLGWGGGSVRRGIKGRALETGGPGGTEPQRHTVHPG